MSKVWLILYSNGRIYEGPQGTTFEGDKKSMQIERDVSLENLKSEIRNRLMFGKSQVVSKLSTKMLVEENPRKYIEYIINDDSDIRCMIDFFNDSSLRALEMYVGVDVASTSTTLVEIRENGMAEDFTESEDKDWIREVENYFTKDEEEAQFSYVDSDELEGEAIPSLLPKTIIGVNSNLLGCGNSQIADLDYESFLLHYSQSTYINLEYSDQEIDYDGPYTSGSWRESDDLYVGLRFDSKIAVQNAIKNYSMRKHQSYITVESKVKKLYLKCPNHENGCPWRMRAILPKHEKQWVIKTWGGQHTCVNVMLSQDHVKLDSNFIASCIQDLVSVQPSVSIKVIQTSIRTRFGFTISYRKAWIAKRKAIDKVFRD